MLIQANDPEERYQAFCRALKEGKRGIEVGWQAHSLCEDYFRLFHGFKPAEPGPRTETDCFPYMGHDINVLRKMARKSGLKLSVKARRGVRSMERNFPVRRLVVRQSDLTEQEAKLYRSTVEEIRSKVQDQLPENWREARELEV